MSNPTLQDSRWASRSSSSRSTFTATRFNNDHQRLSAAPTLPQSTTTPLPYSNSYSNSNSNPHSSIVPRSLSPSKPPPSSQPTKPPQTKAQLDLQSRQLSFHRYTLLLRRLKWKSSTLLFSFHRVFQHIANESQGPPTSQQTEERRGGGAQLQSQPQPQPQTNELDYPMTSLEAETMFKIDFFEYYVLLERVLLHLLGVWGLVVSAGYARDLAGADGDGTREGRGADSGEAGRDSERERERERERDSILGDSRSFTGHRHRFHANVLAALDTRGATPLYEVLGTGIVRDYLGIAKEFRNRWKDAEEKGKSEADDGLIGSRYERLLRDLKLEAMLGEIAGAVERCKGLAEAELRRVGDEVVLVGGAGRGGGGEGGGMGLDVVDMEMEYDVEPWGVVDDAMEMD